MQVTEWRDVVGFEAYFKVSNFGEVYSKRTSKILKQTESSGGYLTVATKIGGRLGTSYCLRVHRLVAEAFLEAPTQEMALYCSSEHHGKVLVRHIDNQKINNIVSNLAYGTCQDNTDDYTATELFRQVVEDNSGGSNVHAAFTNAQAESIRDEYVPRCKIRGARALALKYGVAHSTVSRICSGIRYKGRQNIV